MALLEIDAVCKSFGSLKAVDGVSFQVGAGEIFGVAGPKGSGKSFVHHFAQQYSWLRDNPPQVIWDLGGLHFPPLNTPVDHPLVRSLVDRRKALGKDTEISGFIAVCNAAHYAGVGVDCVVYGCSGEGIHGADEYGDIESLIETTKLVAAAIVDWCGLRAA